MQAIIAGGGRNGATLYDIVSTGDGLNHAIFTDEELESGLARLAAGGLILEKDDKFLPTTLALQTYEQTRTSGNIYEIREALQRLLGAEPWQSNQPYPIPKNNLSYPGFSPNAVRTAVRQWHEEARRTLKSLRRDGK